MYLLVDVNAVLLYSDVCRSALVDGEPIHTLRGHTGSILSLVTAKEGDICFSAGTDCGIRYWELPVDSEPFDEYGTYMCRSWCVRQHLFPVNRYVCQINQVSDKLGKIMYSLVMGIHNRV